MTVGRYRAPRVSVIVPSFNEEDYLPRLLPTVLEAARRFSRGADSVEVIVVDNESTDRTAEIARAAGCRVATTAIHRIGAVRNAGAAAARGDLICFVDADARIHPDTFDAVLQALDSEKIIGGTTGVRMERWSVGIAATYAVIVPLVWATGFDTGLVFCRKRDFENMGGYNESMRFGEDVDFLVRLRRLGRSKGQRLTRLRHVKALASTRKFDEHGEWHYFPMMARASLLLLGREEATAEFADRYWYRVRGSQRRVR